MISRTHAKKEIMRLSATSYFPMKSQAISELVDALQLRSRSNEHATLVISEALNTSANCPTVADLNRLCLEVGRKADRYPPPCDRCIDQGGNFMMATVTHKGTQVEAMTRCDCPRGQLLQTREEEEKRKGAE